jgi:hypothetical protein
MNPQQREREVLDKINENRIVSKLWFHFPQTRKQALNRLVEQGVIRVKSRGDKYFITWLSKPNCVGETKGYK